MNNDEVLKLARHLIREACTHADVATEACLAVGIAYTILQELQIATMKEDEKEKYIRTLDLTRMIAANKLAPFAGAICEEAERLLNT